MSYPNGTADSSNMKMFMLHFYILLSLVNVCGCCSTTYTGPRGTIRSPNGSGSVYPNNIHCNYTIVGSYFTGTIEFTVERFQLESCCDYLSFGPNERYNGKRLISGTTLQYNFTDTFTLSFKTDGSGQYEGFVINYKVSPGCPCSKYGTRCSENCAKGCQLNTCSSSNGHCQCVPGWKGDRCNLACTAGNYGVNCTQTCSTGCQNTLCDPATGSCQCSPGWMGEKCDRRCQPGRFGINCGDDCSEGCSGGCNRIDGTCSCKPGWTGTKCASECWTGRYGVSCGTSCSEGCSDNCDKTDGRCTCKLGRTGPKCLQECPDGTYGYYCMQICSPGCANDKCNKINGGCTCEPGYMGSTCSNKCSFDTYGINCAQTCSVGCEPSTCDPRTGECHCLPGWKGGICEEECGNGSYGAYCNRTCSIGCVEGACESTNGTCICSSGYSGETCDIVEPDTSLIAGTTSGCTAIVLVVIGLTVFLKCRKSNASSTIKCETTACQDDALELRPALVPQTGDPQDNVYVDFDGTDDQVYQNTRSASEAMPIEKESVYGNVPSFTEKDTLAKNPNLPADVTDDTEDDIYEKCQEFGHIPITGTVSTEEIYVNL